MQSHRLKIQALITVFALLLSLVSGSHVSAQSTDAKGAKVYLPYIASTTDGNDSVDTAESLVQGLNQKYANLGFNFFVLKSEGEEVHASGMYTSEVSTFKTSNLLQIANEEDLEKIVDSIYNAKQKSAEATPVEQARTDDTSVKAASLTTYYKIESWYEPACGTGAYFFGGVFCTKNIGYHYQIDDVLRKVTNPQVSSSYLSGLNIALGWTYDAGTASMLNSKTATVRAYGHYTLGVQIQGLNIGLTWSNSWARTVTPPCAVCK